MQEKYQKNYKTLKDRAQVYLSDHGQEIMVLASYTAMGMLFYRLGRVHGIRKVSPDEVVGIEYRRYNINPDTAFIDIYFKNGPTQTLETPHVEFSEFTD
jgi:hypothetical protein